MSVFQNDSAGGEDSSTQQVPQKQAQWIFTARGLWITPLGALIALINFSFSWSNWFGPGLLTSGWGIALGPAGPDLMLFPGILPESFLTLWLVPVTILLLLGLGIARYWRFRPRWLRFWAWLLTIGSLVIMGTVLANGHYISSAFWFTALGLVLAACGLFARSLYLYPINAPAPESTDSRLSRRKLVLNLAGLVGVGGISTWLSIDFSQLTQRAHAYRYAPSIPGQPNGPNCLAWSPNGEYLAGAIGDNLQTWEVTPEFPVLMSYGESTYVINVAWSPDGRLLAATDQFSILGLGIWDAQTGKNLSPKRGDGMCNAFAWSPDGSRMAIIGQVPPPPNNNELVPQTFQIWDVRNLRFHLLSNSEPLASSPATNTFGKVAWSPDGRLLATIEGPGESNGTKFSLWDAETEQRLFAQEIDTAKQGYLTNLAWSPDSRRLALTFYINDNDPVPCPVVIWDVATRQALLSCWGQLGASAGVTWSPDGTRLASGGYDKTIQVWNATTGQRIFTYQGHSSIIDSVVWSPNGKLLASIDNFGTLLIWDAPSL